MAMMMALALAVAPPTVRPNAASRAAQVSTFKPAPPGKVSTDNPRTMVARLQADGYRAKLVEDPKRAYIEATAEQATFYIEMRNCSDKGECDDAIVYSTYAKNKEKPATLETINAFNRDHRFVRAYLDSDGDPVVEMDLIFTDRLMEEKSFSEIMGLWADALAEFHEAIDW